MLLPRETLNDVLAVLAADEKVEGVYVGGSVSRGDDDEVSDLDLWVEGERWSPEGLCSLFLHADKMKIGGVPFVHGVAVGGTILDVLHGPKPWDHYVPLKLPSPKPLAPSVLPNLGLVGEFWATTLKHRKNLWRGHYGTLIYGLNFDRRLLLRAWVLHQTSTDLGEQAFSIFGLKDLTERYVTPERLALLGLPVRDLDEIVYAIQAYRDEMTSLFPRTTELETTVRSLPLTRELIVATQP